MAAGMETGTDLSRYGRRPELPSPEAFYRRVLPGLKVSGKWASARCPIHEDRRASLSVNLEHGGFVCHACGAKGRSILSFVMARDHASHAEARKFLEEGRF